MPSAPSWLLLWLLNEVVGYGGARTEPPNLDFVVAIVAGGWPSLVPCLPTIMYDCVSYLVWQHLSLQWLRVYCRSVEGLLRVMIPLAKERHASSLGSLLKMRILEVAPPVVALSMVVPPYFAKPVLVLSLI